MLLTGTCVCICICICCVFVCRHPLFVRDLFTLLDKSNENSLTLEEISAATEYQEVRDFIMNTENPVLIDMLDKDKRKIKRVFNVRARGVCGNLR